MFVFTPGTSAPFPLFLPSPVISALPPLLFPPHSPLPFYFSSTPSSLLLSFTFTSTIPILPLSLLTLPSFPMVEKVIWRGRHATTSNRPERRAVLVAWEMARFKFDIAAISETRFYEQGQLEEVGAGYTFFWSDRPKAERRYAGVAFAIRNDIVGRLPCLPQGINDRLMSLRVPLRGDKFATIINAYSSDEV
ncbi:unnamed protein product [Schistocephalus solidus]|uniref:Uncharacterized protein n=1 Tax=Schistocephalus solidus TaxID=70667 RepID=A0A183TKW4_SCHSO|nr:unnamed protein product [Schistocephalus solidus]